MLRKEINSFIISLLINIVIAIMYTMFLIVFRKELVGFFKLGDYEIIIWPLAF